MRPAVPVLLTLLAGAVVAPYPQTPATASCAAPSLVGDPIVLSHDGRQVVRGEAFVDGCADNMGCSAVGCDDCEYDDPETPSRDVELQIVQAGRSWSLGEVDADARGRVAWSFRLPTGVEPGRARLVADATDPVRIRVR